MYVKSRPGNLQLGRFIPAGIPEEANDKTSSDVKSGAVKASFSNAEGHWKYSESASPVPDKTDM